MLLKNVTEILISSECGYLNNLFQMKQNVHCMRKCCHHHTGMCVTYRFLMTYNIICNNLINILIYKQAQCHETGRNGKEAEEKQTFI